MSAQRDAVPTPSQPSSQDDEHRVDEPRDRRIAQAEIAPRRGVSLTGLATVFERTPDPVLIVDVKATDPGRYKVTLHDGKCPGSARRRDPKREALLGTVEVGREGFGRFEATLTAELLGQSGAASLARRSVILEDAGEDFEPPWRTAPPPAACGALEPATDSGPLTGS